jgi:hypothetical protein
LAAVATVLVAVRRFWKAGDGTLAGRALFLVSFVSLLTVYGARG